MYKVTKDRFNWTMSLSVALFMIFRICEVLFLSVAECFTLKLTLCYETVFTKKIIRTESEQTSCNSHLSTKILSLLLRANYRQNNT